MKRELRIMAAATAAAAMLAALPALPLAAALTGDVDGDGAVGVTDVIALNKYLLGVGTLTAAENADVYADGTVDVLDLGMLKRLVTAETAAPVYIHMNDTGIVIEGDDASVVKADGLTATITASGIYYIDGTVTDGQIIVSTAAADIEDVELVLDGVTFTNSTRQAIYTTDTNGSDKTKLTLLGDNVITDVSTTAYTTGAAAVYTNNKLTVARSSTGTLTISSYMNDGIHSEKKLSLNGGTITIDTDTAPADGSVIPSADGITSDKAIEIEGGALDLDTSGDGIKTDSTVTVTDGTVSIKAGNDALQAGTSIAVSGGYVTASGDRGLRLTGDAAGNAGSLAITGGTLIATATDYQFDGNEAVDTSLTTQAAMAFDLAAEWKKASLIGIGGTDYASRKKYDYVLISSPAIASDGSYAVTIGGAAASHEGGDVFQNTGAVTYYKTVTAAAQ